MNYHVWITIVNWDAEPTVKYQAKFRQGEPMVLFVLSASSLLHFGLQFRNLKSFEPENNLPVSSVNHMYICKLNWNIGKKKLDAEPTVKYQAKFRQEEPMLPCYILGYSFET